jgi:threonine dehydrogenase-like Zn-dependent dehydrogenase
MKVKLLATDGTGEFREVEWEKPPITDNQICVKALMTGVCRSDIDMVSGKFGPLPLHMQGHEGLARVVEVGKNVVHVKVGETVATRGEPAYADFYNVRDGEFVVVPEAHQRYILEPIACGLNVVDQASSQIREREGKGKKLLILGSGFLSWVAYTRLKESKYKFKIDVVGRSNRDLWKSRLKRHYNGEYDVVIDLSNHKYVFTEPILNNNSLVIFGAQKSITTDFSNLLWKACTMVFPSPRTPMFLDCMYEAEDMVTNGTLNVDKFWTRGYQRNTEWAEAFSDGINRKKHYSRGFIVWD